VAWKVAGADQYSVWNTDSDGNYIANAIGVVSGTSSTLESFETSFHQDLNGDGVIGVPSVSGTVIETFGSTSLVEVGNNFYLNSISSGSGPELKHGGTAFVAGQAGAWRPIGAEQTATGYEVTWKVAGADQYSVWNTDSDGNYIANAIGVVSGTSSTLESFETSFHQDLNGDGTIGPIVSSALAQATTINATASPNDTDSAAQSIFQKFGGAGNDTFVFQPDVRADAILDANSTAEFELGGFSSVTNSSPPAVVSNNAQTEHLHSLFQSVDGGHDTVINTGNHDSLSLINLHTGNFIIH
jgi:hypothetical protein